MSIPERITYTLMNNDTSIHAPEGYEMYDIEGMKPEELQKTKQGVQYAAKIEKFKAIAIGVATLLAVVATVGALIITARAVSNIFSGVLGSTAQQAFDKGASSTKLIYD